MNAPNDQDILLSQLSLNKTQYSDKSKRPGQWSVRVIFVLIIGLFAYYGLSFVKTNASTQTVRSIVHNDKPIVQPERQEGLNRDSATILDASGYVTARRTATVSAQVSGLIVAVDVEEGLYVEKEQILARLDDAVAQIDLQLAQAQIAIEESSIKALEVDLEEATRVFIRLRNVSANGDFSSKAQLTQAQANMEKSRIEVDRAKKIITKKYQQIKRQHHLVNNHIIRAPFSGVVIAKNAQVGEIISPSSAGGFTRTGICTIVDMSSLEIEVDINESLITRIYPQQRVIAYLDAYQKWPINASVISIIPTANRAKATFRVRIKIEETDKRILPNMGIKVSFLE